MKIKILASILLLGVLFAFPSSASAQSYSFAIPAETVQVYWNLDGSLTIDYTFVFRNDAGAHAIDYVDVGMPNEHYDLGSVQADIDGRTITDIRPSPYVNPGVALGLGASMISGGAGGTVHMRVGRVTNVLYPDDQDSNYVSGVFSPTWFDSSYVHGSTDLTVTFHLPAGVGPDAGRYHLPSGNWPGDNQPAAALDSEGRVAYTWHSAGADGSTQYKFGASFPAEAVPATAVVRPSLIDKIMQVIGPLSQALMPCICIGGIITFVVGLGVLGAYSDNQRKKQYLPPKISIEGHGIKRGLTAVEAALLMEQPLDKVMTMILFGLVKKGAATVANRDPLQLEIAQPISESLNPYEQDFLKAFQEQNLVVRRKALQTVTINLIKSLQEKMKGFSRKETVAYYKSIIDKAWSQVAAAGTPEVKAQALDDNLEWTMLDQDFDSRSRDTFGRGMVFAPLWWGRYDPTFRAGTGAGPAPSRGSFGPTRTTLPHLPGSDFAASVVGGVQSFSRNVIGDLTGFTGNVTSKTNPVPVSTYSSSGGGWRSGGGGHSCACACACAGCACACAGGGR